MQFKLPPTPLSFAKGIAEKAIEHTKDVSSQAADAINQFIASDKEQTYRFRAATYEEANSGIKVLLGKNQGDRLAKLLHNGLHHGFIAFGAVDLFADSDGIFELEYGNWRIKKAMLKGDRETVVFPLSARNEPLIFTADGKASLSFAGNVVQADGDESIVVLNNIAK
ncbi:hypothetical protein [Brucella pseudogrignonensis]|uniref:Uncharacterized protein n=1 Tax=Brucella pseudogrignonensis TaxID=419475 RepID=A0ABU1MEY6_9HYPH|nr:hypothetical protein [Brucella pseudogrignonensis]MDR6434610.1 hypothetical protein [Brucella pseudogrignonensis]